jgi:hypothetical protein
MKLFVAMALSLGFGSVLEAEAKSIRIEVATVDSLTSVDVVADDKVKKSKGPKKRLMPRPAVDVSGKPVKPNKKGNAPNAGKAEDIVEDVHALQINEMKGIDLEVAEDNCIVDLSFNLASGKVIEQRNIDVCGIDAITVNEVTDALQPVAAPAVP